MTMRAARYYGPGAIRVEQIEEPTPKPGQVKVKIAWNGICGSDLHAYLMPIPVMPTATEPSKITGETLPVTMGHEFSGTIVQLGPGVEAGGKWKVGQNVVIEPVVGCLQSNTCYTCAQGTHNLCPSLTFIGLGGWGGGLSEYITVDTRYLHILPEGIPLEIGAMIEPLSVAWYAVKRAEFKPGQTALIVGGGPIGLFILKVLRSIDPTTPIFLSEPADRRRALALAHGATHVLNPLAAPSSTPASDGPNPKDPGIVPVAVLGATQGRGVDVVFDAAGIQGGLNDGLMSVRYRGKFVNVSIWEKKAVLDMNLVVFKEVVLTGTMAYTGVHQEVLEAVAARKLTNLEDLITKKIHIEEVVKDGFLALLNEKDKHVKILVYP